MTSNHERKDMKNEYIVHPSSWDGIPNWDVCRMELDDDGNFKEGPYIEYSCFNAKEAEVVAWAWNSTYPQSVTRKLWVFPDDLEEATRRYDEEMMQLAEDHQNDPSPALCHSCGGTVYYHAEKCPERCR
jgi:hypothetical protein